LEKFGENEGGTRGRIRGGKRGESGSTTETSEKGGTGDEEEPQETNFVIFLGYFLLYLRRFVGHDDAPCSDYTCVYFDVVVNVLQFPSMIILVCYGMFCRFRRFNSHLSGCIVVDSVFSVIH
jgi:hypothetical protein